MNRKLRRRQEKLARKRAGAGGRRVPAADIDAAFGRALGLYREGRPADALAACRGVLADAPGHADATYLMGLLLDATGATEEAVRTLDEATRLAPHHADAYYNLGTLLQRLGRHKEAEAALKRAVALRPDDVDARLNLGNAQSRLGRHVDAVATCEAAVAARPDLPQTHNNLGTALRDLGRIEAAVAAYRRACELKSDYAEAHNNLANALREAGHIEEAIAHYRRAIAAAPALAEAHDNLGEALEGIGRFGEALAMHRTAARLKPDNALFWQGVCRAAGRIDSLGVDADLAHDILHCLAVEGVDVTPLGRIGAALVLERLDGAEADGGEDAGLARAIAVLHEPVVMALLGRVPFADAGMERLLTHVRRRLLLDAPAPAAPLDLLSALARQCFLTEYVFAEAAEETAAVAELAARCEHALAAAAPLDAARLAMLACYRPLSALAGAEALPGLSEAATAPLAAVVALQVEEPLGERELKPRIRRLTGIAEGTSAAVRAQYEENPFPRWRDIDARPARPAAAVLLALFPHLRTRAIAWPEAPRVLVAGCGTGRHALVTAARFAGCRVLATDLSLSSLAYASRQAERLGAANVAFAQTDIMEMAGWEERFDIVECAGVLHHLGDPLAGWRILAGLVGPDGLMKIGLYSERARSPVVAARAFIAERGYRADPEGIRRCRRDILDLPPGHPARAILRFTDFYAASSCRDLIFNVVEHRFTPPAIADALESLGLEFLGFEPTDPALLARYRARFPDDAAATSLERWDLFEREHPETFVSMYQFWVRKD